MGLVSVAPIGAGRFEVKLGSGGYHPHRTTHLLWLAILMV